VAKSGTVSQLRTERTLTIAPPPCRARIGANDRLEDFRLQPYSAAIASRVAAAWASNQSQNRLASSVILAAGGLINQ